ncbi:MAG: hypothetical protein WCO96_00565 [Actinomycetes bacterium]
MSATEHEPVSGGELEQPVIEMIELDEAETARIRKRVRLMVQITSRAGKFRSGLAQAAKRLTPAEAAIIADLETHGLDVRQLREVLCGAHVLVDEPGLYERWRFPDSHERLSSHHKKMDKKAYPDLGLRGPLVREKLHGRTANGTWVQLEKTPAAMGGGFHLPSLTDLKHLLDYFVYRVTKKNVGPWGLSGNTESRPMYLSPDIGTTMPLPASAEEELTTSLKLIEQDDDVTSASPDLAVRFPPPDRADSLAELVFHPGARNGRGLFGASDVYVTEMLSPAAQEVLDGGHGAPEWMLPVATETKSVTVKVGDREIATAARINQRGHADWER